MENTIALSDIMQTVCDAANAHIEQTGKEPAVIYFASDLVDRTGRLKSKDGFTGKLTHIGDVPIREDESLEPGTVRVA